MTQKFEAVRQQGGVGAEAWRVMTAYHAWSEVPGIRPKAVATGADVDGAMGGYLIQEGSVVDKAFPFVGGKNMGKGGRTSRPARPASSNAH